MKFLKPLKKSSGLQNKPATLVGPISASAFIISLALTACAGTTIAVNGSQTRGADGSVTNTVGISITLPTTPSNGGGGGQSGGGQPGGGSSGGSGNGSGSRQDNPCFGTGGDCEDEENPATQPNRVGMLHGVASLYNAGGSVALSELSLQLTTNKPTYFINNSGTARVKLVRSGSVIAALDTSYVVVGNRVKPSDIALVSSWLQQLSLQANDQLVIEHDGLQYQISAAANTHIVETLTLSMNNQEQGRYTQSYRLREGSSSYRGTMLQ